MHRVAPSNRVILIRIVTKAQTAQHDLSRLIHNLRRRWFAYRLKLSCRCEAALNCSGLCTPDMGMN
jgi:hypothetical protein